MIFSVLTKENGKEVLYKFSEKFYSWYIQSDVVFVIFNTNKKIAKVFKNASLFEKEINLV